MKASIQRMLAFCKYRADAKKNKSGQGLAEAQEVLEAYRKIGDSDRRGFIQAYQKFGLEDLKWMGSYTKKAISSENEVDTSLKGMMTMARIFKLNGLHASDYDPKKQQQQLLEGLLKESEDFWGHSRSEQVNKNLPELSRFFYRTLVESKDETEQKEENLFELSSEISAKALKNLNQPTIKLENPEKMELQQLARTSSSAVKRLEGKQSELSALLIAMEANEKVKAKVPE
ncbi:unnamed protein product, partial [Symbiodinium necroappetens]